MRQKVDKVSLVIRTMNEKTELQAWLNYFYKTPFGGDLEIIVSDNESTDGTIELAKKNNCKVVVTPRNVFSYPKSLNAGIAVATNELVVSVVAHAFPLRSDWLQRGLRHFDDPNVVGVYAAVAPGKNASPVEWVFYGFGFIAEALKGARKVESMGMGVFGATNIIIRKSVWERHRFDESYSGGGEDYNWAEWALGQGYDIVSDPAFSVRHSHGLGLRDFFQQYKHWREVIVRPVAFDQDDIKYKKHLRH